MVIPVNSPRYVIGINGGGTKSEFVVIDSSLRELARVTAGPANFQTIGSALKDLLRNGITAVVQEAGLSLDQISGIGAGIAGVDRPLERQAVAVFFEELYPGIPLVLENDAVPALFAGVGNRVGVLVISGTGSIALGYNAQGERKRAGGWGHYIDQGSGYWIAREALHAVASADDGTALPTALTGRLLARLNLQSPSDLIGWLYIPLRAINEVAQLASEVVALESTDPVAAGIISRAADVLATYAVAVARQLGFTEKRFPVVMSGSLFAHSMLLRELFSSAVTAAMPNAVPLLPERDGAVGAGMMALDSFGVALPQIALDAPSDSRRATEKRNILTLTIQDRPTLDFAVLMNTEDQRVPRLITSQLPAIAALVDAAAERFTAGGRIFFVGAGTSGRLALLDAAECFPTFGVGPDRIAGILAGGETAMIGAVEGAEDDEQDGRYQISSRSAAALDTVIGVAASGSTPFVIGALREASDRGALTGCIVNAAGTVIPTLVQHPIIIPTGAEVIMGSTRLKAGTAQKLALNMLSTGIMMRVGRTFGNLMTDMQLSNVKLRKRAGVIVADATGLPLDQAVALLEQSGGEMKTAIAAALLRITPDEARKQLEQCDGNLQKCVSLR